MKKIIVLITILLFIQYNVSSQEQNANWFFGTNAGLDFTTNPVSVTNNSQISNLEKSASISDASGNLLFYTNGKTVWNKNHGIMQNGNATLNSSSTENNYESVIILPIPNTNKYYVFTENVTNNFEEDGFFWSTYYFSVINMDSNNGLGTVETLNKVLLNSLHEVNGETSYHNLHHNMTTALHANGEDYWLVLKPNDYFYSFLISDVELNESPNFIASNVNCISNQQSKINCTQYQTEVSLKTSPNSDKLALINDWGPCLSGSEIRVFDFNNSTGVVNNCSSSTNEDPEYIALEFSSDGNYIYVLKSGIGEDNSIAIYDSYNPGNLVSSISLTSATSNYILEGNMIQRGIDNNIYFINGHDTNVLSVIKNTNDINALEINNNYLSFDNSIYFLPKLIPYQSCVSDFYITQEINASDTYNKSVSNTITATNNIQTNAFVTYDAGIRVYLKPGFKANSGTVFNAYIEGCAAVMSKNKSVIKTQENIASVIPENVTIYPNPFSDELTISSNEDILNLQIFSLDGKVMNSEKTLGKINTSDLSKGIYVVKVTLSSGEIITKKILKK